MTTKGQVAHVARMICDEYAKGNRGGVRVGKIHFELSEVARCSEFVREVNEAAAETADHGPLTSKYFGNTARETEAMLRARHTQISREDALPGDIVCFNNKACVWGHIGIHLGNDEFAENTSSKGRGPGFVISRYPQIGYYRMSGFYAIFPAGVYPQTVKLIRLPGNQFCEAELIDESYRLTARAAAKLFGYRLVDHVADQGKLYFEPEGKAADEPR